MILVVDHSPDWARNFEQESDRIGLALGDLVLRIHHIGSTSVSSTKAKPVIDMLLEVASLQSLDERSYSMAALGYEVKGEFGIPGRRYFRLDDETGRRTHQVHAFEAETQHVIRHIAFRDYMRADRDIAVEYGELKARLAKENPNDMQAYVNGKDAFVKKHERCAVVWMQSNHGQQSA